MIDTNPGYDDDVDVHENVTFTEATRIITNELRNTASSEMIVEVMEAWYVSNDPADHQGDRSITVRNGSHGERFKVEFTA